MKKLVVLLGLALTFLITSIMYKTKYLTILLASIMTVLLPIKPFIFIAIIWVLLDTFTGVYTTLKIKGRSSFRSGILINIAPKIFFYSFSIVGSFLIEKYIFEGSIFGVTNALTKGITFFWIYIESKSIDENSQKLGNRPFLDVVRELLSKMKSLKKDINELKES